MEYTKKMALVPPELLRSLKHQEQQQELENSPTVSRLLDLDDDMNSILKSNDTAEAKFKKYQQVLQRYLFLKEEQRQPIKMTISTHSEGDRINPITYLDSLPKNSRRPARTLINHLEKIRSIDWNANGEITIQGQRVLNSNILDLVDYMSRNVRKAQPPHGYDVLVKALLESNVPLSAIVNTTSKKELETGKSLQDDKPPAVAEVTRRHTRAHPYAPTIQHKGSGIRWVPYKSL